MRSICGSHHIESAWICPQRETYPPHLLSHALLFLGHLQVRGRSASVNVRVCVSVRTSLCMHACTMCVGVCACVRACVCNDVSVSLCTCKVILMHTHTHMRAHILVQRHTRGPEIARKHYYASSSRFFDPHLGSRPKALDFL